MNDFKVYYSGACFESGRSLEAVEEKVHNKIASMGQVFEIEAIPLRRDDRDFNQGNYIVSFEGEITVQAEKKELAENQVYDRLASLGQITIAAFQV